MKGYSYCFFLRALIAYIFQGICPFSWLEIYCHKVAHHTLWSFECLLGCVLPLLFHPGVGNLLFSFFPSVWVDSINSIDLFPYEHGLDFTDLLCCFPFLFQWLWLFNLFIPFFTIHFGFHLLFLVYTGRNLRHWVKNFLFT